MIKVEVYKHLMRTYGYLPFIWLGALSEMMKGIVHRILSIFLLGSIVSYLLKGEYEVAQRYTIYFLLLYVAAEIVGAIGEFFAIRSSDQRYRGLTLDYYSKLLGKDISFYRSNQLGALAASFRQHLDGTMTLIRLLRRDFVGLFVALILAPVSLFYLDSKIGSCAIAVVTIQVVYIFWASATGNKLRSETQSIYRRFTGEIADQLSNIVACRVDGQYSNTTAEVAQLADQEAETFWRRHRNTMLLDIPRSLVTGVSMAALFWVVIASHSVNVIYVVVAIIILIQTLQAVLALPDLVNRYDEHFLKVYATLKYLSDSDESVKEPSLDKRRDVKPGDIELDDVTFSYASGGRSQGESVVFCGLTFAIRRGERIGIVGLNGAGKSTLAGLLMRFYDVQQGVIKIGGNDIRDLSMADLKRLIAYVPQEPTLFNRSIWKNIAFARPEASEAAIVDAAKAAHIHDFILSLNAGYETIIGDKGVQLSGGQKQRVAIARALLKDAEIYIFDEATSALDGESERLIRHSLQAIDKTKTVIFIAHRLSTVAELDRIVVLENGRIVEEGDHQTLIGTGGRYQALWEAQIATAN